MKIYVIFARDYEECFIDKAYVRKDMAEMRAENRNHGHGSYYYGVKEVELIE